MKENELEFVSLPFGGWRWLVSDRTIIGPQAIATVGLAFEHGGYVAGGFGHIVMSCLTGLWAERFRASNPAFRDGDHDAAWYARSYLNTGYPMHGDGPLRKARRGDIDVFFRDRDGFLEFERRLLADAPSYGRLGVSPMGSAVEVDCDGCTVVQLVRSHFGPPVKVMSTFDIANAMVAFDPFTSTVVAGWEDLERVGAIHVHRWTTDYVIRRISKWVARHGMTSLSASTAAELPAYAVTVLAKAREEARRSADAAQAAAMGAGWQAPVPQPLPPWTHPIQSNAHVATLRPPPPELVIGVIRAHLEQFSDADVLMLCAACPTGVDYNFDRARGAMMQSLIDRMAIRCAAQGREGLGSGESPTT